MKELCNMTEKFDAELMEKEKEEKKLRGLS